MIVLISIVLLRLCDCASDNLFQPFGKQEELENRLNKTLMTLLKKAAKVLILIIAGIAVLSETGINVATLITGIGLGGLTIALAAQDTAQNLFGGWSSCWISLPGGRLDLHPGHRGRGGGHHLPLHPGAHLPERAGRGAKFHFGLLPHHQLVAMNKRRASFTVGLTYNTTEAQLQRCISRITEMINQNSEVLADDTVVAFQQLPGQQPRNFGAVPTPGRPPLSAFQKSRSRSTTAL